MKFVFYDYPKAKSVFGLLVFGGLIASAVFELITTGSLDLDRPTPGRLPTTFGALYVVTVLGLAFILMTDGKSLSDFLVSNNKIELTNEAVRIKGTTIPYDQITGVKLKGRTLLVACTDGEQRFRLNCADEIHRRMQAQLDARP